MNCHVTAGVRAFLILHILRLPAIRSLIPVSRVSRSCDVCVQHQVFIEKMLSETIKNQQKIICQNTMALRYKKLPIIMVAEIFLLIW